MYIEEDENEIIFNNYERQAVGNYLYNKLNKFSNIDKDDFIHSYGNDRWEEGVNIYFDGRIYYYHTLDDIDICFEAILSKNDEGRVEIYQQNLLKNNQSRIDIRGGNCDKYEILRTDTVKEIIEVLDNIASEVFYQAGDVGYWFGGVVK